MNQEIVVLVKISQSRKNRYCVVSLTCGNIKKVYLIDIESGLMITKDSRGTKLEKKGEDVHGIEGTSSGVLLHDKVTNKQ